MTSYNNNRKHILSANHILGYFLILAFLISGCGSSLPPLASFEPDQSDATQAQIEIDPLSTVTFQVEIPADQ
jgi:hypothetical protein